MSRSKNNVHANVSKYCVQVCVLSVGSSVIKTGLTTVLASNLLFTKR